MCISPAASTPLTLPSSSCSKNKDLPALPSYFTYPPPLPPSPPPQLISLASSKGLDPCAGIVNWAIKEDPWKDLHFPWWLRLGSTPLTQRALQSEQPVGVWVVALASPLLAGLGGTGSPDCFEVSFCPEAVPSPVPLSPPPPPPALQTRLFSQDQIF